MKAEGLLFVLAGTALSLARQVGAGALDTVYAEDGAIFLADAYSKSTLDALATTYAGYLHTVPRLVAEPVSLLPPSFAATALAGSAALITALLAMAVYTLSADVFSSRLARYLVSAVVLLVPVGQHELPNSIANLHWPALYVLFWLLLARASAFRNILILLITLSDVLTVVFLPLALWRWHRRRDPLPAAALVAGLVVQAVAMFLSSGGRSLTPEPIKWAPWWLVRAVPPGLLGERWFIGPRVDLRWLALAGAAWLIIGALVFLGLRFGKPLVATSTGTGDRPLVASRVLAALAVVHCAAVYALPVALSGDTPPRYAAAPAMLLTTALAALLLESPSPNRPPQVVWAGRTFVALCLVVWAANLRIPNDRAEGPLWSEQLRHASASCPSIDEVTIAVSPPGWQVIIPCKVL